ncbi:DNA methyltransferase [Pseudotabrizicola sp. 4114]|uniref:Eco57I restriction-modification methylase domain-containing protein n=1 Tax=Pseudotabrizicola sp. 4114 TaxID=2817731 RepID=UPI0028663A26|nr:type I restriction-modification system DNA methylase subunit [Pseudorhodobacter sp. 4114]
MDLALGRFGGKTPEILAPFELKGADTRDLDAIMPGRNKTPVQQAWEYAMNARGVKWVLVSNMIELRLYGFGEGTTAYETFQLDRLTDPNEYARFMLLLSADSLLSGRTRKLLDESRDEDKDITNRLYQDYKALRLKLIGAVQVADPAIAPLDAIAVAQKILDRVLFIAFAEDTGLLDENTLKHAFEHADPYNPHPIWDNFKGLFRGIDLGRPERRDSAGKIIIQPIPRYNGGLFRQDDTINALALPDDVCEGFKTLGDYDFASEVSVTVLGHIFEQSIADVERLQAQARGEETEEERATGTTGRRKRDGVVYTPDYIARFIVAETLGAHLEEAFTEILRTHAKAGVDLSDYAAILWRRKSSELEAWQAYRDRLKTLRIVDPACGSGVFLIMAFDFLKAELGRVNDKIALMEGKIGQQGKSDTQDLFDPDSEILTNNLFGVDVNSESIEIAKLSLWIKTARRGKVLDSLSDNLRVGDSLIGDSNVAYLNHPFDWKEAFPKIFAEDGFDVVLGNPPYVRMEHLKAQKPYLEERFEVASDRADLYCYFYERGLRLLKPGGRLGYISSNTFFKTGSGKPLRDYLRREATIEGVVDFGDLQIFEGVTTYPAILTMKRGAAPKGHELRFWKVDALPEGNFQATWGKAAGPYPQAALGAGSWELENTALRTLRDKIRTGRKTLKDVYGSPLYGIKTGLNGAFVIDNATKERLCAQDPKSADLLKPFLEGKDLKRWRAEPRSLWLIYIPQRRVNIDDYPAIRDWLLPFKAALEARATKQEWFELQQAQEAYSPFFQPPKIAYGHFQDQPIYSMETTGAYSNNKTYFIPNGGWDLLAVLNSKVIWFDFCSRTTAVRGGWREATAQHIEPLPMPSIADTAKSELQQLAEKASRAAKERLTLQTALTRRIPDLCPPNRDPKLTTRLQEWWTLPDFAAFRAEVKKVFKADIPLAERSAWEDWITRDRAEIGRLSAEITKAEAQIDSIVYGLFDLTPDEIALLESVV